MARREKKKEPLLILGEDVNQMTDDQLKEHFKILMEHIQQEKETEFHETLESDLIRTAWEVAEETLKDLQEQNKSLKDDLNATVTKNEWQKSELRKSLKTTEVFSTASKKNIFVHNHKYFFDSPDDADNIKVRAEWRKRSKNKEERKKLKLEMMRNLNAEEQSIMDRRQRLADAGVKLRSWKMIVNPDDPDFFGGVLKREFSDKVVEMKQEMKLCDFDYTKAVGEVERTFDKKMLKFTKLWARNVRNPMVRRWRTAMKKRLATYVIIKKHKQAMDRKTLKTNRKLHTLLYNLDRARRKMILDRDQWRNKYLAEKFNVEKMMITETYDTVIKQLKDNHKNIYEETRQFFKDTAENDILLIMSLKNEIKTLNENMEKMEEEIILMNANIEKIKGPLEESEKETRWMETFVAAIEKDTKSLQRHKKRNELLQKTIEGVKKKCTDLEEEVKKKQEGLAAAEKLKDNLNDWCDNFKQSNAFVGLMKKAFNEECKKIEKMEKTLLDRRLILHEHIPVLRDLVNEKVKAVKRIEFARQKEVKAFNELVNQLEIRSKKMLINNWPKLYKMEGIPYRKSPANIISTFDPKKRYKKIDVCPFE